MPYQNRYSFFFLLILSYNSLVAAAKWSPPRKDTPSVKIGIVGTSFSLDIDDPKKNIKTPIQYRPNSIGRMAIGIEYLGFGASLGFTPEANEEDEVRLGKTKGEDYQFRFLREQNSFDLFYQKYEGFYIANSKDIDPTIQGNAPLIQRHDLRSEHIGLQYYQTLSPESLSLAACFDQSGWQKENGGSFFIYSSLDKHQIVADASLIPAQLAESYSSIQTFQGGDFTTAKLGFGGAYALVYNHFYIAGKLIISGGQQRQNYNLENEKINRTLPTTGGNGKLSLGYNGDTFFSSLNLFNDITSISIHDRRIQMGTMELSLFFGMHL